MTEKKLFLIILALLSGEVAMLVALGAPTIVKMGGTTLAVGVIRGIAKKNHG